jgi:hypothetical protein
MPRGDVEAGEQEGRLMFAPIVYFCARYSRHEECPF